MTSTSDERSSCDDKLSLEVIHLIRKTDGKNDPRELNLNRSAVIERLQKDIRCSDVAEVLLYIVRINRILHLDLSYNSVGDDGFRDIVRFLTTVANNIQTLNLMNNAVTADGTKALTTVGHLLRLREMRLNGNKIGPNGVLSVLRMLQHNTSLRHLDLGETDMSVDCMPCMDIALNPNGNENANTTLRALNMNRIANPLNGRNREEEIVRSLRNVFTYNHSLLEIHLQKIGMTDDGFQLLVEYMTKGNAIEYLDVGCNRIKDTSMDVLSRYMENGLLHTLILDHNQISDAGVRFLSRGLPGSAIEFLDLSHNRMTDEGAIVLLQSLIRKPVKMTNLFICGNPITDATALWLSFMFTVGVLSENMVDVEAYHKPGENEKWSLAPNWSINDRKARYYRGTRR